MELDFDARYSVEGYGGIAFYLLDYKKIRDEDYEWSGLEENDTDWVQAVMVGDDRIHEIEVSSLTLLSEDDYCSECGQIGCKATGG